MCWEGAGHAFYLPHLQCIRTKLPLPLLLCGLSLLLLAVESSWTMLGNGKGQSPLPFPTLSDFPHLLVVLSTVFWPDIYLCSSEDLKMESSCPQDRTLNSVPVPRYEEAIYCSNVAQMISKEGPNSHQRGCWSRTPRPYEQNPAKYASTSVTTRGVVCLLKTDT